MPRSLWRWQSAPRSWVVMCFVLRLRRKCACHFLRLARSPVVLPGQLGQLGTGPQTPRLEYRGWFPFCVAGKGKSEAHRRIEATRGHGHPEFHLDYAYMGSEAEDKASPILVGKFSKDRWLITHHVPCKGTQHRWIVGKLVFDVDHELHANTGGKF